MRCGYHCIIICSFFGASRSRLVTCLAKLDGHSKPWALVRDQVLAAVVSAARMGWKFTRDLVIDTQEGALHLLKESPKLARRRVDREVANFLAEAAEFKRIRNLSITIG